MRRAWQLLRREPALPLWLLVALALPSVVGLMPLDRALAPLLDLRPAARALVGPVMDDTMARELLRSAPSLGGSLIGGLLVALLLAAPAVWLAETWVAVRALDRRVPAGWGAARGLGVALMSLPLRLLPVGAAAVVGLPAREAGTFSALLSTVIATTIVYALVSGAITILVDVARGFALAEEERGLVACLGAALREVVRRPRDYVFLLLIELASMGLGVAIVLASRPVGLFRGALLAVAIVGLTVRAATITFVVAAATGAASRSA